MLIISSNSWPMVVRIVVTIFTIVLFGLFSLFEVYGLLSSSSSLVVEKLSVCAVRMLFISVVPNVL